MILMVKSMLPVFNLLFSVNMVVNKVVFKLGRPKVWKKCILILILLRSLIPYISCPYEATVFFYIVRDFQFKYWMNCSDFV